MIQLLLLLFKRKFYIILLEREDVLSLFSVKQEVVKKDASLRQPEEKDHDQPVWRAKTLQLR